MLGPGWQVGNYIVDGPAPFAHGTFGTLYIARRASDEQKVAVKFVWLTKAEDGRERLEAERHGAMLQQRFEQTHGMVPRVFEYGPYNEHLYIAMEFVEGKSLAERIRSGLTPHEAAQHAAGICDFLEKAHRFETVIEDQPYDRIVHADLKPDHILISESGEMKVLDFGIAKALEKTTEVTTNNWSTVAYASPERLQSGGHVNVHADFWSLGVMLYEMVSGHLPYPAFTPRHMRSQLEQAIRTNARPEPLPASCPPDLAAIVTKLMAHQPEHRYPSASAIREDLERFLAGDRPAAFVQYDTPATVPIRRMRTERSTGPAAREVPATEPFPSAAPAAFALAGAGAAPVAAGAATLPNLAALPAALPGAPPTVGMPPSGASTSTAHSGAIPPATPGAAARLAARRPRRHMLAFAAQLFAVIAIAAEGGAWMAAERYRSGIHTIEGRTLAERRQEYEGIRDWAFFDMGLHARVDRPLSRQLVAIADTVIADYRRDGPTATAAEWRQAKEAMEWALSFDGRNPSWRARLLICEGHLARFAARVHRRGSDASREAYEKAIERFRAAAELDDESFDPYLGIGNIQAYGLDDVDLAAEAIEKAESRGYSPGRRERAQLGDGYLKRADRIRKRAFELSGESRREELEKARADYERCVERFTPIRDFGRSGANLNYCRGYMERLAVELETQYAAPWVM
jgi:eukaryotic-like serine/threonine-protein kinase